MEVCDIMPLEKDDDFNKDAIIERLKAEGRDGNRMITYVEFLFSPAVQMLFHILNSEFIFKRGHPAYNRIKLYGIFMYANEQNAYTLTSVSYLCRNDKVLRCFTNGIEPSPNCLDDFLRKSNRVVMKAITICTLIELNDLEYLDFRRIYCDSTDAKINGSVNYKVDLTDLKCFKLLDEWNLLHNGTANKMNKNRRKLEKLLKEHEDDEEMVKYIKHMFKHYGLYRKSAYRKYSVFKKYLDEDPDGYVCVMFPEARFMKTKRGRFEFALLVQQCMLRKGIILPGLLQNEPNDGKSLENIILDLKETFDLMEHLQKYYGERKNYKEIGNALELTIMILDSGYFTDDNLEAAYNHDINVLIMPRLVARRINDKLREKKFQDVEYLIEQEVKKVTKRHTDITNKGYICPNGILSQDCIEKEINSEFNHLREGQPVVFKEVSYNHEFICPADCPVKDICTINPIEDRISVLKHNMISKFLNKRYRKIYSERFSANEQIFGDYKGLIEIIKLFGSNKAAAQNHLYIMNTCRNLKRKVALKDSIC